jgi:hypothetical protein
MSKTKQIRAVRRAIITWAKSGGKAAVAQADVIGENLKAIAASVEPERRSLWPLIAAQFEQLCKLRGSAPLRG